MISSFPIHLRYKELKAAGWRAAALIILLAHSLTASYAQSVSISEFTDGMVANDGFVPFYWDEQSGKVYLEIPVFEEDVLYYVSAASGSGSVQAALDRGILVSSVVHFQRKGPSVLVVQQNLDYRAVGGSAERAANVANSFPRSVLASLPIVAGSSDQILVDGSSLFMRDAGNVEGRMQRGSRASFRFDSGRSTFYPAKMRAFPDNSEFEVVSTFAVGNPDRIISNVLPDERTMTVNIHHSFLRAPTGYTPRVADPRIGVSSMGFRNYANEFDDSTEVEWVSRWRLEKQNPDAAISDPIKPIIFYLDPAIPEPVRTAMHEGTLWWNEAFEAAGFSNAVQVRDPTPDMDPMDIRYAWILWIERDERGFSSGGTFRDPRTGEVLGSKTRMDSHRIRTVANYWESYTKAGNAMEGSMPPGQRDMVLLRQSVLIAHELGHVLGFQHNWAASINERASVMEYPTPRVKVEDGQLDLSESFAFGIGEYDKYLARYAYSEFSPEEERAELDIIIAEMRENDILFVPNTDPRWVWYDDRSTPMEYLSETMMARDIMMQQYGADMLEPGEPLGNLRDLRFWMNYLHHRWAIEAASGYIGGMYHNFVVKGEALPATEIVPAETQRQLLEQLMSALQPESLAIPESLLVQLTTTPGNNIEDLSSNYAFDHITAARILAAMIIEPLLDPERAARLVAFADRQPDNLSLPELVETLMDNTWLITEESSAQQATLRRVTQRVLLDAMMMLGANSNTTPEVRAYILDQLVVLADELRTRNASDPMVLAHNRQAVRDIQRYLEDPQANAPERAAPGWGGQPRSRYPLAPGAPL